MSTNDPMTQERLDAIQERLDARTPGQWEASGREIEALAPSWCEVVSAAVDCTGYCYGGIDRAEDADLIGHAPEDLAGLLAEVERLRALTTVDDDMVERAAVVLGNRRHRGIHRGWGGATSAARDGWRDEARAVLDAALGTGEGA